MVNNALVIAPFMPEYDREGGSRRVYHLLTLLKEAGYVVHFVAHDASKGKAYLSRLEQEGVKVYAGAESLAVDSSYCLDLPELLSEVSFQVAILAFWSMGAIYLPTIRALSPQTKIIIDSIDLHLLRLSREAFHSRIGLINEETARLMAGELNIYAESDAVLAVSAKEAALINDLLGTSGKAWVVPLLEDLEPSKLPFAQRKGILMVGNFRHKPNVEALTYFSNAILPLIAPGILQQHPLYLVGNALKPEWLPKSLPSDTPYLKLVGWVPSLLPYLQQARITVVPLLQGAGTKTKLIQALTVGTPSVTTSIGAEGLDLEDGRQVLIEDTAVGFASAITRLLQEVDLWEQLAQSGQIHIAKQHSRAVVQACLNHVLTAVLNSR